MSFKERLSSVLDSILGRVSAVEDASLAAHESAELRDQRLARIERKLDQVIKVHVETADEANALRSRLIESDSRRGEELHRHQQAIMEHEARLHRLERHEQGNGKATDS